jgi:putative tricarboxylic transport membrane protein
MKAERVSSLFWIAIGLGFIYGSVHLGLGTLQEPGSGLLSLLAGSCLTFLALILFFQSFTREKGMQIKISALWEGMKWHRPVMIGLALLGYILALESVGFIICSLLLTFFMLKVLGNFSWGKAVLISLMTTAFSYLIFSVLLKVMLPKGIF